MKNTVFTVIAVLLLLATVQFAVGDDHTITQYFTVHNFTDTDVRISYKTEGAHIQGWDSGARIQGWYTVKPRQSKRFSYVGTWRSRHVGTIIRMERNGEEIIPDRYNGDQQRSEIYGFYHPHKTHDIRGWEYEWRTDAEGDMETAIAQLNEFTVGVPPVTEETLKFYSESPFAENLMFRVIRSVPLDRYPDAKELLRNIWDALVEGKDTVVLASTDVPVPGEGSSPTEGLEWGRYWTYEASDDYHEIGSRSEYYSALTTTIDGLPLDLKLAQPLDGEYVQNYREFRDGKLLDVPRISVPALGGNPFIIDKQYDNTCGPTSLQMVLHYYGKKASMEDIWDEGGIHTVAFGTTPSEMKQALNGLGVPAHLYDEDTENFRDDPLERLRRYVDGNRPPCILIRFPDAAWHWVVVVGYIYKEDFYAYLIADPNGHYRWINGNHLDDVWSHKAAKNSYDTNWEGGFRDFGANIGTDPYTAIVPRNGASASSFYEGLWTELKVHVESGKFRPGAGLLRIFTFGLVGKKATRPWDDYVKFHYPFDSYSVSEIKLASFTGTAKLTDHSKRDEYTVDLRGKIEDGAVIRGRMWVFVRTFRDEEDPTAPAAPAQVTLTRLPEPTTETSLLPNYPNPFNPETWIPYQLSEPADVEVLIYSVDGRLVRRLALGWMPSGVYRSRSRAAYWDGRNASGESVASGVYFYTLRAGDFSGTRKLVIRK